VQQTQPKSAYGKLSTIVDVSHDSNDNNPTGGAQQQPVKRNNYSSLGDISQPKEVESVTPVPAHTNPRNPYGSLARVVAEENAR
jgi:hypothetical protein